MDTTVPAARLAKTLEECGWIIKAELAESIVICNDKKGHVVSFDLLGLSALDRLSKMKDIV